MEQLEYVAPIKGAAEYFAGYDYENAKRPCVFMRDTEGYSSCIQYYRTIEKARIGAIKWQKKENATVLKAQKQATK